MECYRTERLVLRPLLSGDEEMLRDFLCRNRQFWEPWEPGRDEKYYTTASAADQILQDLQRLEDGSALSLYLFKPTGGGIVGRIALSNIVYGAFLSCFLGYKLDAAEIGCGFMGEALDKVVEIAFGEYGLHRIEANIIPRNSASIAVVRGRGFREEGRSPRYLKINGRWEDHLHFVLLNDNLE